MELIDVVVVSHNSIASLRRCVEPLASLPDVDVVVVDNASSDGSLHVVADLPVRTVQRADNAGFGRGCNEGWRSGRAPFVLFLNPDASLDERSLRALATTLETQEGIGATAPRILADDGTLDWSQRRFPRLRSTYARAFFLNRVFPRAAWSDEIVRDPAAYDRPGSPEWVSGACILVRRTALERLGGFDERFFLYSEDVDLCRRLRDAGLDIRFEPGAVVRHDGGGSGPRAQLLPLVAASRRLYADKHSGRVAASLERAGLVLEALTRSVVTRGGLAPRAGRIRSLAALVLPRGAASRRPPAPASPR